MQNKITTIIVSIMERNIILSNGLRLVTPIVSGFNQIGRSCIFEDCVWWENYRISILTHTAYFCNKCCHPPTCFMPSVIVHYIYFISFISAALELADERKPPHERKPLNPLLKKGKT
ncbi:MAG: hypothetical protein WAK17_00705 [Candidatus Nitrosopolaris sp.]